MHSAGLHSGLGSADLWGWRGRGSHCVSLGASCPPVLHLQKVSAASGASWPRHGSWALEPQLCHAAWGSACLSLPPRDPGHTATGAWVSGTSTLVGIPLGVSECSGENATGVLQLGPLPTTLPVRWLGPGPPLSLPSGLCPHCSSAWNAVPAVPTWLCLPQCPCSRVPSLDSLCQPPRLSPILSGCPAMVRLFKASPLVSLRLSYSWLGRTRGLFGTAGTYLPWPSAGAATSPSLPVGVPTPLGRCRLQHWGFPFPEGAEAGAGQEPSRGSAPHLQQLPVGTMVWAGRIGFQGGPVREPGPPTCHPPWAQAS
ncbi:uncharacterized protein LOC125616562 [Marmota marmota marmota]|uniref:uncharacterized protein LOC125616562 n=1 Tax=Marmota marmota marmota TaxID=9994 RepID=UPI0020939EF5|nr:uncharacterized protein LOC125616562 [Marmota marmota marmota]